MRDREIEQANLSLNIITSSNSVEFLKTMIDQQLGIGFQTMSVWRCRSSGVSVSMYPL